MVSMQLLGYIETTHCAVWACVINIYISILYRLELFRGYLSKKGRKYVVSSWDLADAVRHVCDFSTEV